MRASLYIGSVWIREAKELHLKRLLIEMVRCGGGEEDPPAGDEALPSMPKNSQANVDDPPVQTDGADTSVASSICRMFRGIDRHEGEPRVEARSSDKQNTGMFL